MNGAKLLIQALIDNGTEVVFGYPGATILSIYDELYKKKDKLRHVLAVNEQSAGHAADGYARATGKVGVVIATSGPGATNLVTALATAYHDSVPLVAITGNVEQELIGRDSFQEVDITGITNPITKHNFLVRNAASLYLTIRLAFEIAASGRKGPVLVDIPRNITEQELEAELLPHYTLRPEPFPSEEQLQLAVEAINDSKRPLILAGGGVVFSDASQQLSAFAKKLAAPVCTTLMGLSAIPSDNSENLGLVGKHGSYTAFVALNTCDLLIACGTRFSDRVAGRFKDFAPDAKLLHIDIDRSEISKNVRASYSLVGGAAAVLDELCRRCQQREQNSWRDKLDNIREHHPLPKPDCNSLDPRYIIQKLCDIVGDELIITTDVGQHQLFAAQYGKFRIPRSFISSCGLGTMGYGMGAAIGAAIGMPNRKVVLISGDGSFHMNMGELASMVTENLPIVILVMNNGTLGMVYQWQLTNDSAAAYTDVTRRTDYAALANALGAEGITLSEPEKVDETLRYALSLNKPCVVDCRIDRKRFVEKLTL